VDLLRSAIDLLTAALGPVMAGFASLKPALTPAANFLKDTFTVIVNALRTRFETMTQAISQRSAQLAQIFQNIGTAFSGLWEKAQPHLENLRTLFLQVMGGIADAAGTWVGHLMDCFQGLTGFLAGAFTGNWTQAWDGLKLALKSAVNGIIGLLNSLLSGLAAGLNLVTSSLNKWQVEVPQWVPKVGGKTFGFDLPAIAAPQVPYLAQGAVLPANKPFLAVVGDQKHGTNIEAPLSTIQEAVAMTMEDFSGGNMAGHAATVAALEELLAVVRNIRLGDDDIAAACRRSQTRRAVMKGGGYAL
jgi:phage-related protein